MRRVARYSALAGVVPLLLGAWLGRAAEPVELLVAGSDGAVLDAGGVATLLERLGSAPGLPSGRTMREATVAIIWAGESRRFRVERLRVMAPSLAARYPAVRAFRGRGLERPSERLVFALGPRGLSGRYDGRDGSVVIEPVGDGRLHRIAPVEATAPLRLGPDHAPGAGVPSQPRDLGLELATFGEQTVTYRIAVAATGEYTAAHGGTVVDGLAAVVAALAPVIDVFERELGIRLRLVAANDRLIYIDPAADPFTNGHRPTLLQQNQATLDQVLGDGAYDLGHVFRHGYGGWAEGFGSVCRSGGKAAAMSSWAPETSSRFSIGIVAHEIGHQFGATHSFNTGYSAEHPECAAARWEDSAWEPGWGATVMSYGGGGCGPDEDYVPAKQPWLHAGSREQVRRFVELGNGRRCGVVADSGNTVPRVDAGPDRVIPARTPFTLVGEGADADGDPLQYSWEQLDVGGASPPLTDDGSRPLFRFFPPDSEPRRTVPRLDDLLRGALRKGESWATTDRNLNFRLTARDGRGAVATDAVVVTTVSDAGPFVVRAPASGGRWRPGRRRLVTWDVAGTRAAPVRCRRVDISLSVDGGQSFAHVLAGRVRNSGRARVTVPEIETTRARVRITCRDNIFFALSAGDFTIAR